MRNPNLPQRHVFYKLSEVLQLSLLDSPHLIFADGVIQTSHVSDDELLSVPGLADTKWMYERTTHEWIPLFYAAGDDAVRACVDVRPSTSHYDEGNWITPKGFPRLQYEEYDHA